MAQAINRETLLQELEGLTEDQIPEVLDFIRFLKAREEKPSLRAGRHPAPDIAALRILAELDRIREDMEARYGIYPGDPVREVREMREHQTEEVWKPSS